MKKPEECNSIEDVRHAIDEIDREVMQKLGLRFQYVKKVVEFKKKDPDSIIAKKRYDEVIEKRRQWAAENGLSSDVIEKVYKTLLDHFIAEEMKIIENK